MKYTSLKILTVTVVTMIAGAASAGLLTPGDFAGMTPETFEGYDIPINVQEVDFGPFSISGYFESYAYVMPITAPVELPAIGGDGLVLTLDAPLEKIGFDMGTQWAGITIRFIGPSDQLLGEFLIEDIAPWGTGFNGFYHQGFVGFEDDGGEMIHRVELGSGDQYIDNVVGNFHAVAVDAATWGGVKSLFR